MWQYKSNAVVQTYHRSSYLPTVLWAEGGGWAYHPSRGDWRRGGVVWNRGGVVRRRWWGARDGNLRERRFLQTGDVGVDGRVRVERAVVLQRERENLKRHHHLPASGWNVVCGMPPPPQMLSTVLALIPLLASDTAELSYFSCFVLLQAAVILTRPFLLHRKLKVQTDWICVWKRCRSV